MHVKRTIKICFIISCLPIAYLIRWATYSDSALNVGRKCCKETTLECQSCFRGQTVDEFCTSNPRKYDCQYRLTCCHDTNMRCLACLRNQSLNDFCNEHRGLYGCRGDIMVSVYLFQKKMGYTRFTSSVMRQYHHLSEMDIYVFDDASPNYQEKKLREWYGEKANIFREPVATGLTNNLKRMLSFFLTSDYTFLFIVDAETIFLPDWRNFIKTHLNKKIAGFLSLHHSAANHRFDADCENPVRGKLCKGGAFGTFRVAINRQLAKILVDKIHEGFENLNWTAILGKEGIGTLYPEKSLTMQIGQRNQDGEKCGENDVPYRFNRCAFPDWIRNGIEFYFDRCTGPDEFYFPELSMKYMDKEGRFWTRPVISYTLYGSRPRYTKIARENAARVFSIYPGWKIWIYTDGSVPDSVMSELCEFDIRFIDMSKSKIKSKMTWRFLVASEPVKMYAIRDIDSWLLQRGKAAVDEWIKSGRKFHVLRDHPNHSMFPMSGGMWGGIHDAIPNMKDLIESRSSSDKYMQDMYFLNDVIWKIASKSVWVHDSHSLHKFGEDHPFPTERKANESFVGDVVIWPE